MVGNGLGFVLIWCLWWFFIIVVVIVSVVCKFFVIVFIVFDWKWFLECEELWFFVFWKMYKDGVIIFGGIYEGGVVSFNSCVWFVRVRL